MLLIREEIPDDYDAIRKVNQLAFHDNAEAQLVNKLPNDRAAVFSFVAVEDAQIVGHIPFCNLAVKTGIGVCDAVSLAAMDVLLR